MGVLTITLPLPATAVFPLPGLSSKRGQGRHSTPSTPPIAERPTEPLARLDSESDPSLSSPRPLSHGRDTLGKSQTVPEAHVQRTPEQLAEQETTLRLVQRCLQGDAAAWQQLVVAQHRRLYGVCYRFTGSPTDAEDLTQEAFLKIYANLASFDGARGSFTTWIMTLTRNLLVDHFRRTRMQRATDSLDRTLDGSPDSPTLLDQMPDLRPAQEEHIAGLELRARVQAAVRQLSPELREAVILRDLEDMDYKEIARVLRVPEGTVKSRISRGRGELARLLGSSQGQVA